MIRIFANFNKKPIRLLLFTTESQFCLFLTESSALHVQFAHTLKLFITGVAVFCHRALSFFDGTIKTGVPSLLLISATTITLCKYQTVKQDETNNDNQQLHLSISWFFFLFFW